MAEKLTPQPNMEYIRDLLSPYLDDEVTDEERAQVDVALAGSPELRDELESLRQIVALVAVLPRVAAPRPFTLTEAAVQAVAPKSKKPFTLPSWLGGLAAAAALLVCVLALGSLFRTSQDGGGMVGDVAMAPQQAAEEPGAEEPQEESYAEEPAAQEEAPAEQEAPAEEAAEMETLAETVEVEQEAAKEIVVEQKVEEATTLAPLPAETTDADSSRSGENGVGAQAIPTLMAMATTTPSPALAAPPAPAGEMEESADAADSSAVAEQPAEAEEFAAAEAPPAEQADTAQKEGALLQLLDIQNQVLQIAPGLIYLEGVLDVGEGTVLAATLQRNGNPFDDWAKPATLQTTVEINGRFKFNIVAADPSTSDLFGQEPATYQIVITSPGPDTSVMAFAYFDTLAPPAATATPTVAVTPSPTVVAVLTILPSDTPDVQPTPRAAQVDTGSVPLTVRIIVILAVVVVIVVGVIVWRIRK